MPEIIANVEVVPHTYNEVYKPFLEKVCGTYPLMQSPSIGIEKYQILLDRDSAKEKPIIKARVVDHPQNLEFIAGIKNSEIKRKLYHEEPLRPKLFQIKKVQGYANPIQNYPDLNIIEEDNLYFLTKRKLLSGEEIRKFADIIKAI